MQSTSETATEITLPSLEVESSSNSSLSEIKLQLHHGNLELPESDALDEGKTPTVDQTQDNDLNLDEWATHKKHIFVLSWAGKPIYSRHGNEDKLAWLFGVIQTLVSFVQANDDEIKSIWAGDTLFVFVTKKPLILLAVSKTGESVPSLTKQLNYVYHQIASVLTLSRLNRIYDQRQNYDLRRLLSGVERLIDHLVDMADTEPSFTINATQYLSLPANTRETITSVIVAACNKIKNLVFAILMAKGKLITMVRMKKYSLDPSDLHLLLNLVDASESFKEAESWTPLCLPQFDGSGFLYGHVSYLADDCQACLLLLTIEKDVFYTLSDAKQRIVSKLRLNGCMQSINEALDGGSDAISRSLVGAPTIRHFLYKCKKTSQFCQPPVCLPYNRQYRSELSRIYKRLHTYLHELAETELRLVCERTARHILLGWDTEAFELYVVLEPFVDTAAVISVIDQLIGSVKKMENQLFLVGAPTF